MVFQERTYSVLLVSAGGKFNQTVSGLLPPTHFGPVRIVKSSDEARRTLVSTSYDMVLINAPLPDDLGVQLAISICGRSDAGVLLFVKNEVFQEVYDKVTEHGVLTISKPTSTQLVLQSVRDLCALRERLRKMEEKHASIEEKMQEIRLANRAKWAVIQCLGMSEEAAHHYLEKQAMDHRISRREAAIRVLATYQPQEPQD